MIDESIENIKNLSIEFKLFSDDINIYSKEDIIEFVSSGNALMEIAIKFIEQENKNPTLKHFKRIEFSQKVYNLSKVLADLIKKTKKILEITDLNNIYKSREK